MKAAETADQCAGTVLLVFVFVLFLFVGLAVTALGLVIIGGPKAGLRNVRELEKTGVEVPATLLSLKPYKTCPDVVYEYTTADGSRARHNSSAGRNPLHAVAVTGLDLLP
ncbi:hypothetical protein ABT034_02965 [Streptomyces sp. NPDC002773]|uniref:hypothetical protein n=1 Tax=Streptomyces sp. NPDC002773 TaxID=3154430 RepID=UPI0033228245